ncbi:MAG TPA: hypothetical protein VFI09_07540 [Solirubrobacterales bacterium]|nr:hypothetical protein [Solirubrobacterales bacterium]
MAQTKTRASSKRPTGSKKSQARSRGSSKKAANSRKPAVGDTAAKATSAVGAAAGKAAGKANAAAGKAKVPLIAGGAALAGVAGGAALGARQAHRHRRGLAKMARGVGALGVQAGHLASELQRSRESTNGQHRSPLEVVLEGLTARRSRD